MRKVIVFSFVLLFILGASLASAAPNVASLNNRGSLLVFPLIQTTPGHETYIKLSNDANAAVDLKCYWVKVDGIIDVAPGCREVLGDATYSKLPPKQSPTNFGLTLTRNQPVMFKASTGENDAGDGTALDIAPFGAGEGYLACWAVNADNAQINWNFLTGEAVVVHTSSIPAFEYNAYAFGARSGSQGSKVGTPGTILLDGVRYDTTPLYLIYNFPPKGYAPFDNIEFHFLQGSQDFKTMTKKHHGVKANVSLWNENEAPFSGVGTCAWCWKELYLDGFSNSAFLTFEGLGSSIGRMRVQGVASAGCLPDLTDVQKAVCLTAGTTFETYNTGLLGVAVQHFVGGAMTVNAGHTGGQLTTDKFTYDPLQP